MPFGWVTTARQIDRVDPVIARRRRPGMTAGTRSAGAIGDPGADAGVSRGLRKGVGELLRCPARREVLVRRAANDVEVAGTTRASADRRHRADTVPTKGVDVIVVAGDGLGQPVGEHRRRVVDREDDIGRSEVLDTDGLVGERGQARSVRGREQRPASRSAPRAAPQANAGTAATGDGPWRLSRAARQRGNVCMKDRRSPASRCSDSGARAEEKHAAVAWNAVWIAPPGWFMRFPLQTVAWYVAPARQAKRPDMRYRSRNKRLERSANPSQAPMFCARLSTTPTSQRGVFRAAPVRAPAGPRSLPRSMPTNPPRENGRSIKLEGMVWQRFSCRFTAATRLWSPLLAGIIVYDNRMAAEEVSLGCRYMPLAGLGFF